jgi:hypothetical protein
MSKRTETSYKAAKKKVAAAMLRVKTAGKRLFTQSTAKVMGRQKHPAAG